MNKSSSTFISPLNSPLSNYDYRNTLSPKNKPQFQDQFSNPKLHTISEDFDKSFASNTDNITKKSQVLSKVERKDTRETEPGPFDYILRIQQSLQVQKSDPLQQIIKKSQIDPFLRRKLKAVVDNDLKCLKKLNDQKNKVSSQLSKTISTTQSVKILPKHQANPIDEQISRLPKDISKILNTSLQQFSPPSIKKIQSQANLMAVIEYSCQFLKKKEQINMEQLSPKESFTTLRRELYKKKINCLEVLRDVKQKSLLKGKKQ